MTRQNEKSAKELIEHAQNEVKRAQRYLDLVKAIVPLLPSGVEPQSISLHGYKCDASIRLEVDKCEDAVPLMAKMEPEPAFYLGGSTTAIVPFSQVSYSEIDIAEKAYEVAGFHLDFDFMAGYGTKLKVQWWTKFGNLTVLVNCECRQSRWQIRAEHNGKWTEPRVELPGRNLVSWGADQRPLFSPSGELLRGSKRYTVYFDQGVTPAVLEFPTPDVVFER